MARNKKRTSKVQMNRIYHARPATLDFRDQLYPSSLLVVPSRTSLEDYGAFKVSVLDQGEEGGVCNQSSACHKQSLGIGDGWATGKQGTKVANQGDFLD